MSYDPNAPRYPRPPAGPGSNVVLLVLLVAALFALFVLTASMVWMASRYSGPGAKITDPTAKPRPVAAPTQLDSEDQATVDLFKKCSKSVVYIATATIGRDFNFNMHEIPKGTGSGFVWDEEGRIVTNYHVVEEANRWQVTLSDQSSWNAVLVGVAPDKELAVLKIDAPRDRLVPIDVGRSADLQVGQRVFAIGNPFGLDQTLTTGIISGLGREIKANTGRVIDGVIQTDAAINPGNSGGPLLDRNGNLIGVNTAIYSPSGASAGVGFAIPVDSVNRVVPQIVQHGRVIRPGMGIRIASDDVMRQLGLTGVLVINVIPGGAAQAAGMKPTVRVANGDVELGDIIVAINGKQVRTIDEFSAVLEEYEAGNIVDVEVLRSANTAAKHKETLKVTLQSVQQ